MELYYLMSITDRERAEDMAALYRDAGLNLVTTMMGRGTATPQQLALYGLSRTEKAAIMNAINKDAGPSTPAGAISFSLPVSDVAGLRRLDDE